MDLTFQINVEEKFNVRSAAVIKYNDYYLIGKRDDKDYYSIPGGRINFGEDSKRAVIRELKEELNFDVSLDNIKLVRIIENFFYFKDNTKFSNIISSNSNNVMNIYLSMKLKEQKKYFCGVIL